MKSLKLNKFIGRCIIIPLCVYSLSLQAQTGVGVNTTTPKSSLEVNGSLSKKVTTITASTTLDTSYNVVICNNGASAITVTQEFRSLSRKSAAKKCKRYA